MSEFKPPKIEKGIPVSSSKRENGFTEFLRGLQIGDSFVWQIPKGGGGNFHAFARFAGIKVTTRTLEDKKTMRVWRIA